jgi:hypothetical protein
MERVGFLIEETGERLGCLLNPETIEISRQAGVRPRKLSNLAMTGRGLKDDPLLYTGGGRTELKLDLLFDTTLGGSSIQAEDVRSLTQALWRLSENEPGPEGYGRLPAIRFIWGKSWNIPCVIAAIAERFESFNSEGTPRRSWIRLRLLRAGQEEDSLRAEAGAMFGPGTEPFPEEIPIHEIVGGQGEFGEEPSGPGERLDQIAERTYGDPSLWRRLAEASGVEDPLRLRAGLLLRCPPRLGPWRL